MAWETYQGMTRNMEIPDEMVSISPRGSIGFSRELSRPEMASSHCEVAYDAETGQLRLTLLATSTHHTYVFREDGGRYRLDPIGALRQWGLIPSIRILCRAWWDDRSLIIQLPTDAAEAPEPQKQVPPKPKRKRGPRAPVWVGREVCGRCGKVVAYRLAGETKILRAHDCRATPEPLAVPASCLCAVCGGEFKAVPNGGGVRPYSHRVDGAICKGVFQQGN